MKKLERVKTFLRSAAVADADHDFSGGRSGESTFREIFKKHKDIGTPNPLSPEQQQQEMPISEYKVLNMFLGNIQGDDEVTAFRTNFLKGEPGIPKEIMSFQRWEEDPIPYTVTALHLGSKDEKKDYIWHMSSEDLYKFMNPHNQANAAFAVDAVSMPFYECLQKDPYNSQKPSYVANYIISREAMNDAAGKIAIGEKQNNGKQVQINVKNDTSSTNILYPAIQMNGIEGLSELECFFSNYNLVLGPMGQKKGAPVTTLSITDKQFSHQVQVMKHNKENAHPNSVPFISKFIDSLKDYLFKSGNKKEKTMYNFSLQQKRSGDWLQVLALLTPERFGLPSKDRIAIVSLDKICVAYALFAGVDVFFTYFDSSTKKYWFVRFHKNYNTTPMTQSELLQNDINAFLLNADESGKPEIISDQETYETYKKTYNDIWNNTDTKLSNKFAESLQSLDSFIQSDSFRAQLLEKPLKAFLYDATTLAVFRSLAVKLQEGIDENVQVKNPVTSQNIDSIKHYFSIYKHNFMALKTALIAKKASANGSIAISSYFNSIFIKNGAGTVAQQTRNDLIDNLVVFKSFFNKANGGANGIGIFTFLNEYLTNEEKESITDTFEKPTEKIVDDKLKTLYKQFVATVSYLTLTNPDPAILEPIKQIPPSDLLESIEAVIQEPNAVEAEQTTQLQDDELIAKQEAAETLASLQEQEQVMKQTDGSVQVPNNFHVTDFAAALALLSFKLQNCEEQVEDIKAKTTLMLGGSPFKFTKRSRQSPVKYLSAALKMDLIHNPLATFYFLLREISFRLSEAEGDDSDQLIAFSQFIIQFFTKKPNKMNIFKEYMYYINLENYILETPINFIAVDVANSVKQGYYGIQTLPSLGDASFTLDFSNYKFSQINYNEQININLEFMKKLVKDAKTLEDRFASGRATSGTRKSPRKSLKVYKTQKKRSGTQKKRSLSPKTARGSSGSLKTPTKYSSSIKRSGSLKTPTETIIKKTQKRKKQFGSYGKSSEDKLYI